MKTRLQNVADFDEILSVHRASATLTQVGEGAQRLSYGHLLLNTLPFFSIVTPSSRLLAPVAPSMLPFVYLEGAADCRCCEPGEETVKKGGVSGNR